MNNGVVDVAAIKEIIAKNKKDLAFVIGNGINRYFLESSKSWEEILISLWNKCSEINIESIPNDGLSYTEFYDLIELQNIKDRKNIANNINEYVHKLKIENKYSDNVDHDKLWLKIDSLSKQPPKSYSLNSFSRYMDDLKKISESINEITSNFNEKIVGYGDVDEFSFESSSILDIMNFFADENKLRLFTRKIKQEISNDLRNWDSQSDKMSRIINEICVMGCPILTTNYDNVMCQSIKAIRRSFDTKERNSDFYPWNVYYNKKIKDGGVILDDPCAGFGIWHIHGECERPRSIRLGLCDYMGCVEKARKLIKDNKLFRFPTIGMQADKHFKTNSWIDIVFNKSLFIFGLALDENEVLLRWLLIQRAKYNELYHFGLKGWYVISNEDDKISDGKKLFLESVGFEIVTIGNYKEIYEDVWN